MEQMLTLMLGSIHISVFLKLLHDFNFGLQSNMCNSKLELRDSKLETRLEVKLQLEL